MLNVLLEAGVSILLGLLIALVHAFRTTVSKNFLITLAVLPIMVQLVIMLVNGNLGTGVAVMGAFSLIRFRSVAGGSKELMSVFWAMAVGLATGTGHLVYAAVFTLIIGAFLLLLNILKFGSNQTKERLVKITLAEDLDFPGLFDPILDQYASSHELVNVRTTNMGSLYELRFQVTLKDPGQEKQLIDDIRVKNGNLPVSSGQNLQNSEVL